MKTVLQVFVLLYLFLLFYCSLILFLNFLFSTKHHTYTKVSYERSELYGSFTHKVVSVMRQAAQWRLREKVGDARFRYKTTHSRQCVIRFPLPSGDRWCLVCFSNWSASRRRLEADQFEKQTRHQRWPDGSGNLITHCLECAILYIYTSVKIILLSQILIICGYPPVANG